MLVPSKPLGSTRRISVLPSLQASSRISGERALAALRRVRGLWVNGGFFATKRGVITSDVDIDNNPSSTTAARAVNSFSRFSLPRLFLIPIQAREDVLLQIFWFRSESLLQKLAHHIGLTAI